MKTIDQRSQDTPQLRRLARFLRRHAGRDYDGFSPDVLDEFLAFHLAQGTLVYTHRRGRVRSVGVAWQCWADEVLAAEEAGVNPFYWKPTNPAGDALYLDNMTAREPLALAGVMLGLANRFPNWTALKLFTHRRGRLTQLSPTRLTRLYRKATHEPGI